MRSSGSISPSITLISRAALVGVFRLDGQNLLADDPQHHLFVGQHGAQIGDRSFPARHILPANARVPNPSDAARRISRMACACLSDRAKRSMSCTFALRRVRAVADDADDLVDVIQRDEQAFQNVGARLGLIEVVARAAHDHVLLVFEIVVEHLRAARAPSARHPPAPA